MKKAILILCLILSPTAFIHGDETRGADAPASCANNQPVEIPKIISQRCYTVNQCGEPLQEIVISECKKRSCVNNIKVKPCDAAWGLKDGDTCLCTTGELSVHGKVESVPYTQEQLKENNRKAKKEILKNAAAMKSRGHGYCVTEDPDLACAYSGKKGQRCWCNTGIPETDRPSVRPGLVF